MFSVHRIGVSLQFTAEAVVALLLAAPHSALAGQTTHAPQLTTCGQVQKVTCDAKASHVTTLELKPKSKDQPVTILSTSRGQFLPSPEALYRDTEVCATGRVEMHGRRRRLVVSGPQDIVIRTRLRRPEIPWKGTFFRGR